jgi:hypothetical protein
MLKSTKMEREILSRVFGPGNDTESISKHPNHKKIKAALGRLIAETEALGELENLKKVE